MKPSNRHIYDMYICAYNYKWKPSSNIVFKTHNLTPASTRIIRDVLQCTYIFFNKKEKAT